MTNKIKMRYFHKGEWNYIEVNDETNLGLAFTSFENTPKTSRLFLYSNVNDINGKEIYDGDKIRFHKDGNIRTKQVVFNGGAFLWQNSRNGCGYKISHLLNNGFVFKCRAEVIGHIFENK